MNPITTSGPAATNLVGHAAPDGAESASLLTLDELAARFAEAARALYPGAAPVVTFEAPRRAEFGDLATNLAFGLAKLARKAPQQIAAELAERVLADAQARATVAEATPVAGFVNLRLVPAFWQQVVGEVLRAGADYGRGAPTGERISLEFGSANPTGPLVVVQGRTLSVGDTLAKALRHAGYDVFTEWIINDAGSQMDTLGRSLYARYRRLFDPSFPFPDEGYPGDYLIAVAQALRARDGARWLDVPLEEAVPPLARFARDLLVAEQQAVARRFGVELRPVAVGDARCTTPGAIERGMQRLRDLGALYEKDGATWLRTKAAGDDEDRVVIRSDGRPAYLANDVAYHYDKLQRADRVIDILGPDHHGYIARLDGAGQRLRPAGRDRGADRAADHAQARRRDPLDVQARRDGRHARGGDRRGRGRRGALLLRHALDRPAADVRPGAGQAAVQRQPGLLRAVRSRSHRLGAAPGRGARAGRAGRRPPRRGAASG